MALRETDSLFFGVTFQIPQEPACRGARGEFKLSIKTQLGSVSASSHTLEQTQTASMGSGAEPSSCSSLCPSRRWLGRPPHRLSTEPKWLLLRCIGPAPLARESQSPFQDLLQRPPYSSIRAHNSWRISIQLDGRSESPRATVRLTTTSTSQNCRSTPS